MESKDYHALSYNEIASLFESLKANGKFEQFDFEVKKSGNSINEGQLCGMLNSKGGLVIIGIDENPLEITSYNFTSVQDVQTEIGKIKTQINKIKQNNEGLENLIDMSCIIDPFEFEGKQYVLIKINPSEAVFVYEGRIYNKTNEAKGYETTRKEVLSFVEKMKDYDMFLNKIKSFREKLIRLRENINGEAGDVVEYIESTEFNEIKNLLEEKSNHLLKIIPLNNLIENMRNIKDIISHIERNPTVDKFYLYMANMITAFDKEFENKLDETINCLEKIK